MQNSIKQALKAALTDRCCVGQILIQKANGGFVLSHHDDQARDDLAMFQNAEHAAGIAKYDDAGSYRPLKTVPNLRRGWRLTLKTLEEVKYTLDYFYPGRLALFAAWKTGQLRTTNLRDTLGRQSGIYRVAAKISDAQIDDLVADFCRSDGGCLRTILWKRDETGALPSTLLPQVKFDPNFDQTGRGQRTLPLLCQEACNLLVAAARDVVKAGQ